MKTWQKIVYSFVLSVVCLGIFEIPYLQRPFSKHGAYDWGYYSACGKFPESCPDISCKVHHRGFWEETLSIK